MKSKTKKTVVDRVEITGPIEEREQVLETLWSQHYSVEIMRPYWDADMFPKVDPTRFKIVAEREVQQACHMTADELEDYVIEDLKLYMAHHHGAVPEFLENHSERPLWQTVRMCLSVFLTE